MEWDRSFVDQLDLALNESQVCGLRFAPDAAEAQLLVEVLAMPELGPIGPDPRRVLAFSGVSSCDVILRAEGADGLGPVLPLESLEALEEFFASLGQADAMYGWSFIDVDEPGADWSVPGSLTLASGATRSGQHTVHWFTECGRPDATGAWDRFLLQGVIRFDDLRIDQADGRPVPIDEFVADARRWWMAFEGGDARLSSDAQGRAQVTAASWRSWGGSSVMVPGKSP